MFKPLPCSLARSNFDRLCANNFNGACRPIPEAYPRTRLLVLARGPTRQTRLATRITTLPRRIDLYFSGGKSRQAIWTIISFGGGFYAGNTVSLSFGALAINDVVAAALTAAFVEGISYIYYSARRRTILLMFINSFKMGVIASLTADAFKLGG
eukprot:jgi/Botrbrau1/9348/Bobra.354_2s0007.1